MKRLRLILLFCALVVALAAYYYHVESAVRVETVPFKSSLTAKTLPYSVVLPPGYGLVTSRRTRYPVLYLLHGWGSHYDAWLAHTSLARYVAEHQIIVVTPEGENGWYTDSGVAPDDKYETYILQELIPDVERRFRTLNNRAGRGIAGFSMGGYGAVKFGLKYPEMFAFVGSMSGAFDTTRRTDDSSIMETFGDAGSATREANDVYKLAREFPAGRFALLPYFYLDCGSADPWLATNRELANVFAERKITHEYRELPGDHVWPYWDRQVREVLRVAEEMLVSPDS
ncbi:MAG: alpha/beta hydrolase family protein [Pyrinomonadaceae bacterium]